MAKHTVHEGHRQRICTRLSSGIDSLQDHELLEILLFSCIPRRNTNETAHYLIDACDGFDAVFHTDPKQLATVLGVGPQSALFLRIIGAVIDRIIASRQLERVNETFSLGSFRDIVQRRLATLPYEVYDIYGIDEQERMLFTIRIVAGRKTDMKLLANMMTDFLTKFHPFYVALAHNHPNAPCMPTQKDHEFTKMVYMLCQFNRIGLLDYMIVGNDTVYSYYMTQRLDVVKKQCDMDSLIDTPLPEIPKPRKKK